MVFGWCGEYCVGKSGVGYREERRSFFGLVGLELGCCVVGGRVGWEYGYGICFICLDLGCRCIWVC